MLDQRPGMNQFHFDALIRIAHDHFIAVSEDGRFDRPYHRVKEGITDVPNDQSNCKTRSLLHAAPERSRSN
jgi:hypothetical protein